MRVVLSGGVSHVGTTARVYADLSLTRDMPREQDTRSGKFSQVYTDEDFLGAISTLGEPGTGDVAAKVECSRDHAGHCLRELESDEKITNRTVGSVKLRSLPEREVWANRN